MDKLRQEEKATFGTSSAELEKGLAGLKSALKFHNEYYSADGRAHASADGAAGGIIGLLEVAEADFSKNLAQVNADEHAAVAEYEQVSKDNEIEHAAESQDVECKKKESKQSDKTSGELNSDRAGVQEELDAVLEYLPRSRRSALQKQRPRGSQGTI